MTSAQCSPIPPAADRAVMVDRARNDLFRTRMEPAAQRAPEQERRGGGGSASAAYQKLRDGARAAREGVRGAEWSRGDVEEGGAPAVERNSMEEEQPVARAGGDGAAQGAAQGAGGADQIRAKILETMKKGISESKRRTDLQEGHWHPPPPWRAQPPWRPQPQPLGAPPCSVS